MVVRKASRFVSEGNECFIAAILNYLNCMGAPEDYLVRIQSRFEKHTLGGKGKGVKIYETLLVLDSILSEEGKPIDTKLFYTNLDQSLVDKVPIGYKGRFIQQSGSGSPHIYPAVKIATAGDELHAIVAVRDLMIDDSYIDSDGHERSGFCLPFAYIKFSGLEQFFEIRVNIPPEKPDYSLEIPTSIDLASIVCSYGTHNQDSAKPLHYNMPFGAMSA